jgi:trk system potassium uptake protein TrkH
MNIKGISFYLGLFCFPIAFLAFVNILYSSYFDYFLSVDSYSITLVVSIIIGIFFYFYGSKSNKKINFYEQIVTIILVYFLSAFLISIPYYLSNYQIPFVNSLFEAFSGITGTGFSIFGNIKFLDPTLILWRSSSQWLGGLYFLIFLIQFFSNSQFNYKLNNLVDTSQKNKNSELKINSISVKILITYLSLSFLIFFLLSLSGVRLLNSLNLTMTLISNGGFLPTNNLSQIINTRAQEFILIISFLLSLLNIYLIFNIFNNKNNFKNHYEDFYLFVIFLLFTFFLLTFVNNVNLSESLINVLSSLTNSGISIYQYNSNLSLFFLFITLIGGSILSNSSGIKLLRFYILLKATFIEMMKLVKPNIIIKNNIFDSDKIITPDDIKISFLVFISFFVSLFILSGILLFDNFSFENSFKLSILTLTNTAASNIYISDKVNFANLLTSSKLSIIFFMIIGKIELISFFLIIKKFFFKY